MKETLELRQNREIGIPLPYDRCFVYGQEPSAMQFFGQNVLSFEPPPRICL